MDACVRNPEGPASYRDLGGQPIVLGGAPGEKARLSGRTDAGAEAGEAAVTGHVSTSRPSQARPRVPAPSSPGLLQAR